MGLEDAPPRYSLGGLNTQGLFSIQVEFVESQGWQVTVVLLDGRLSVCCEGQVRNLKHARVGR